MSKTQLKKHLKQLKRAALEAEVIDLYERFSQVSIYYNFAFNPQEDKLIDAAKEKITKEYFPQTRRRPKARRSVALQHIKHFKTIGLDPVKIADLMLFNLETALRFAEAKPPRTEAFYKSMYVAFKAAVAHCRSSGLMYEMMQRIEAVANSAARQRWFNAEEFEGTLKEFHP